ncbi:hypothetical protein ACFWXO_25310 [Kitasatospora sp. NPDC059088]|uniref:hypothetical protein n=1 Tax=Kitasatospora sp. NPDC059088 TaxID=3346722 RepID=UPI0036AD8EDF
MSDEQLRVSLDQVRDSFEVLMRHLEAHGAGGEAALPNDLFWSVPPPELYDMTAKPDVLTIGQVSESWAQLQALLADPDRAIGHHLVWLADVLRAIGLEHPA